MAFRIGIICILNSFMYYVCDVDIAGGLQNAEQAQWLLRKPLSYILL